MESTITKDPKLAMQLPQESLTNAPFIDIAGKTDKGRVRKINTDFFLTADLQRTLVLGESSLQLAAGVPWLGGTQGRLLIVADGLTGSGMGNIASWAAVDGIAYYIANVLPWAIEMHHEDEAELVDVVKRGLVRCQERIRRRARESGLDDRPIGTTMTMAYILWPNAYILHVGDSRAYLMRENKLSQLTSDDTVAQRMVDRGLMDPEEAQDTPLHHVLTNAVGGSKADIKVEHHRFQLERGDQLLLSTNGLSRHLSETDIIKVLTKSATSSMSCRRLVDAANEAGGEDNITAVVAHIANSN